MARDKKLIVGNWKMNETVHEASLLLHRLSGLIKPHRDVEVVVAPPLLALQSLSLQVDHHIVKLAAQNFYWRDYGAYTGEISAAQLHGLVSYALVGHSERRNIFHESDKDVRAKVQAALRSGIQPILCVGETASERANQETHDVLRDQLIGGLANVTSQDIAKVVIAYEPIWAIGADQPAEPVSSSAAAKFIRHQVAHLYGKAAADEIRILYGGAISPTNAADFLRAENVDGLLVGRASLNAHDFSAIVAKAHKGETK